jgi:hypothetical protein
MRNSVAKDITTHEFIFYPGHWQGSGTILILQTGAAIHFTLDWKMSGLANGKVEIEQRTCLVETGECWESIHVMKEISDGRFGAELHNPLYGEFHGDGLYTDREISWRLFDKEERIVSKTQLSLLDEGTYLLNCAYQFKGSAQICIGGILSKSSLS